MKNKRTRLLSKLFMPILCFILFLAVSDVCARAGGSGGRRRSGGSSGSYSTGSGSGSGSSESRAIRTAIRVFMALPSPVKVVVLIIIAIAVITFLYKNPDFLKGDEGFFSELTGDISKPKNNNLDVIRKNNPDFSESQFLSKVKHAFHEIQSAWNKKDLSGVRSYISDGVWQRFNTQFTMMNQLEQTNRLENVFVQECFIENCEQDGVFDIIHVAIKASMKDYFECALDPSMNSGGSEEFVEYWSFIKKRGTFNKDLYNSNDCPACGAPIEENLGEVARCPFCQTLLNSGEYDWVLSEITQAEDYLKSRKSMKAENLGIKRKQLVSENEDFSVQQIEDHVSNGYMQILAAKALHEPSRIKRFVSDSFYQFIEPQIKGFTYLFNRLYLNEVTLIAAEKKGAQNRLYVSVVVTSQRVEKETGGLYLEDPVMTSKREIVCIVRDINAHKSSGSLYMHQCPSCGAGIDDSLDTACPYCGSVLNSSDKEWIFDSILSCSDYATYMEENKKLFSFSVKQKKLDELLTVKEYAIHNIMAVIASDGKITPEEEQFLDEFATKLKFKKAEKENILALAKQNRLQLSLPEDQVLREKIYYLMVEAAEVDGEIQMQEKVILDYVKKIVFQD